MDKKALGKGLSALISKMPPEEQSRIQAELQQSQDQVKDAVKQWAEAVKVNVSLLQTDLIENNPFQPRESYEDADQEDIKASIKEKGILQPLLVRRKGEHFEVIAGERRLRAARDLALPTVPVVIKENVSDSEAMVLALVENIQREDLNVIEEAMAFQTLTTAFQLSQDQIAKAVGKDTSTISNTLRLLKLPTQIQDHLREEKISMGHARAILTLDNEADQLKMAQNIINQNLSVRSVEGLVKQVSTKAPKKTKAQKAKDPDIAHLEDELRQMLGTKVTIDDKKGRGKLIVEYYTLDDLDRILAILRKK